MSYIILNKRKPSNYTLIFVDIPSVKTDIINAMINRTYINDYFEIPFSYDLNHDYIDKIEVIRGHHHFGMHKYLNNKNYMYITMLTDPIKRVISSYYDIKSNKTSPYYSDVNKITLYDYVLNDKFNEITSNVQTKYLCEDYSDNLEKAKYNLQNYFLAVGTEDRIQEMISILKTNLGWNVPNNNFYSPKNSINYNTIPKRIIDIIKRKNQNDIDLFEFAKQISSEYSKKNKNIIVNIPFNISNLTDMNMPYHNFGIRKECLTKEWIDYRINIFMNYTLKSLKNQTNQNFNAYIRYEPSTEDLIKQAISKYQPLPNNIHFVTTYEYNNMVFKIIRGYKFLYEITMSSDDMYHKSFIQQMFDYTPKPNTKILICQNGYIYDSIQKRIAPYFNHSSSFNCLIYSVMDYLNGKRHPMDGFESAIKLPHEILKDPNYINHSHQNNVAFDFNLETEIWPKIDGDVWVNNKGYLALMGPEIKDQDKINMILKEFIKY
ncbi:sulfotransferase family 2 domain-containing protein [Tepidibacter mesophilus]|uniref:sulfotransferase family 2 domain-containing protein n=1 Tax=Tepidibacter mesophilus TaxID=655607 RepID=UPI000C08AFED|nr:sulfotransferase family 2 domain-containing protein [Tepidibacter mesophilus]